MRLCGVTQGMKPSGQPARLGYHAPRISLKHCQPGILPRYRRSTCCKEVIAQALESLPIQELAEQSPFQPLELQEAENIVPKIFFLSNVKGPVW